MTAQSLRERIGLWRFAGHRAAALALLLVPAIVLANPQLDPLAWLARMQAAAAKLNYSGVFVYQQAGGVVQTSRVTHVVEGSNSRARVETLDGAPQVVLRHGEEIKTFYPESKTVVVEKRRSKQTSFPALIGADPQALAQHYRISKWDTQRIAGVDCQVILLEPKDGMRYSHKLWADTQSGLLVKAQSFNEKGEIAEHTAFTQLEVGTSSAALERYFKGKLGGPEWKTLNAQLADADFAAAGWSVGTNMPGYHKVAEVRRVFEGAAANAEPKGSVGQVVFSDGLSTVSVFIEPASRPRSTVREFWRENFAEAVSTHGAVNVYKRRIADHMVTVVGEAPPLCIKQMARAIEFKTPAK